MSDFNSFMQKHGFAPAAKVEGSASLDVVTARIGALETDLAEHLPKELEATDEND